MLTREENELLARTGPGTPMGRLMRRYWVPVLFSHQLAERDGPPVRVKVLCEKLVAFRDSSGKVGLVEERCPHRGASMFFGRNEGGDEKAGGLRCVYHGWKFDVTGQCVDMPSEPASSNFKSKVSITAYPCEEHGGLVWAYMGPPGLKTPFPELEWTLVPASHRYSSRHIQECNWFQAFEGGFDTSHLSFLHSGDVGGSLRRLPSRYEVAPTDYGFVAGTGREAPNAEIYWTASVMLMPFHKLISRHGGPDAPIGAHVWVPIDDERTMNYSVEYHPDRPLGDEEMARSKNFEYIHTENLPGTDRSVQNCDNDYRIDRAAQKSGTSYTGIRGIGMQDCALQESMGPVSDRTTEHLGISDTVIIKLRKVVLKTLKDMDAAGTLPGLDPASWRVRSTAFTVPAAHAFADIVDDYVRADTQATAK